MKLGRDGFTGLAVLAASLGLFWATLGLEKHPMVPVGPDFYPRIVLGLTAVLALCLVVVDFIAHRRPMAGGARAAPANYVLVIVSFAVFAAYVILLPYLGFRVATLAFLVAMPFALERPAGVRGWAAVIVLAVVAAMVLHFVFETYLHVLLPRGRWTGF